MKTRRRRFSVEQLESRVCLTLSTTPYATIPLPADGHWTSTPINGSPIFADLLGDGRQELIVEATGGRILAYQSDASGNISLFKEYDSGSAGDFKSTPVVVTLANGDKGIFAGIGLNESNPGAIEDGRIFGWDATTGQILPGWPVSTGQNISGFTGVIGPLAVADLNGDGVPEIIATSFSHFITAYKLDGSILWRYDNDDTIISGPVVGDIGRDGKPEVIFGGDSSANGFFQAGGLINVLNSNGQALYRIPIGETAWGSPVLADLQGNGSLDILAGAGFNFDVAGVPGARRRRKSALRLRFPRTTVARLALSHDRRRLASAPNLRRSRRRRPLRQRATRSDLGRSRGGFTRDSKQRSRRPRVRRRLVDRARRPRFPRR